MARWTSFLLVLCVNSAVLALLDAAPTVPEDARPFEALTANQAHRRLLFDREAETGHKRSTLGVDVVPVTDFDNTPDDTNCISTPEDFMKVWRDRTAGNRDRCVDPNIIVRLFTGDKTCDTKLDFVLSRFLGRLSPLSFWSNKDGPVKYLRIGIPQTVGSYVDGQRRKSTNTDPNNANWANSKFPGVRDKSNGISLLTQIGFGSDFYRIDKYYMMFVGYRNKAAMDTAKVPTFVATWSNLITFYQDFVRGLIKDAKGNPDDFSIPKEVATGGSGFPGLDNIELGDLTGCPSQCTYEDTKYPLPLESAGNAYPAVTPAALANHTRVGRTWQETCGVPVLKVPVNASESQKCGGATIDIGPRLVKTGRLQLAEPTQLSINEYSCTDPDWKRYYLLGDFDTTPKWTQEVPGDHKPVFNKFPGLFEICNKEALFPGPLYMSAFLKEWYKLGATDIKKKAVLFRAFLTTGCVGNFNQLFSGNGMVYTGFGGVSSVTISELLLGGIANGKKSIVEDKLLGEYAFSFFCLDGSEECCPNRNCRQLAKPTWG